MKILRRIRCLLRQRQMEQDLAEEIEFHLRMSGEPRDLGNITQSREDARAVWIWPWLQSVWQDVNYALRSLRKQPGFTLVALLALGTAIGLNTSFFTVFNAVALRPLPVKDPSRVALVFQTNRDGRSYGFSIPEYRFLSANARQLAGMVVTRDEVTRLGFEPVGQWTRFSFVSGDYFGVLGVRMQLGRGFLPEEDRAGAPEPVAVLSYRLWRDHFGSDAQIVGKQIRMGEIPFTVVGVASEEFVGLEPENLWVPLAALTVLDGQDSFGLRLLTKPDVCCSSVIARLAPGATRESAAAELDALSRQYLQQFKLESAAVLVTGTTFFSNPTSKREITPVMVLMFLGLTIVLLLACANIGNLLVARAAARQHEIEIRRAVGASRARIVRQLLTESLLLALGASGLGLILAVELPDSVLGRVSQAPPFHITPDGTVILYAVGLAILTCLAFGLAPALHGTRPQSVRSHLRLRSVLMTVQVAMSVLLLVGAGLMLEGVRRASTRDPGFAVRDISVISFDLPVQAYSFDRTSEFFTQLLENLKNNPEIGPVGLAAREPLSGAHSQRFVSLPGQSRQQARLVEYQEVSPGYFEVLQIPFVAGRNIRPADERSRAILINQATARQFWGADVNPVGRTILVGTDAWEVTGVVRDTYTVGLNGIQPLIYQPFRGTISPKILVRSNPAARDIVAAAAARLDPRVRIQVAPLSESLDRWLGPSLVGAQIAGLMGLFALALASAGMFGVFAYTVQQRTKEIGIRMALGARPLQVVGGVMANSSRAIVAGLVIGLLASLGGSRLISQYLYGVSPLDPRTYLLVTAILALAAIAASYLPSYRAAKIDPLAALRHE